MNILYKIDNSLYVNLTNKCPCACTFCIRIDHDSVNGEDNLWLPYDPSIEEVLAEFEKHDLDSYDQVVLCGYGEPLTRLEVALEVFKYIRSKSKVTIRINTNGLADLIHKKPTAHLLEGYVDAISISLNAPTAEEYLAIARPKFGIESFGAMLKYAEDCKKYIKEVTFSVVDVITKEQIEACRKLAESMGTQFRVRAFIE